jgi:fructosamine-3-kinase
MALADGDISWQVLRQIVHDWAGASAELDEVKAMDGGHVATTVGLHTKAGDRAVLKLTQHRADRTYADEAHQLELLRKIGIPTPRVYGCEIGTLDSPFSYLLLEFREGIDLAHAKTACSPEEFDVLQGELAGLVRHLHAHTETHYFRVTADAANCKRHDSWAKLYHEAYDPIWHEAEKNGHLPPKCRKLVAKIHERLAPLLARSDQPRLLHGDLWSSNILVKKDETDAKWHVAAILDPLARYGDAECEIAYLELFHTVTPAFMRAYLGDKHLPNEYHRVRKPIYHLYEMLNHLQLFGPEYLKPTLAAIVKVAPLV